MWKDGELGGLIVCEPVNPVVGLVHLVFKRSFWGSQTTLTACRSALKVGFESGIAKLCGMVFVDNNAIRGMYHKLGFVEEGHLRSQTLRGGKPVDVVCCGLTKGDWEFKNGTDSGTRSAGGRHEQLAEQSDKHQQHHQYILS